MHQAGISLLLKKDKNPLNCGSYHPVSLLNTDAKILAEILACWSEKVVPTIISPDQTGFMKDHYSFFNIRHLLNILYGPLPPNHGDSKVILLLDTEKAFDQVEWDYLFNTLEAFKFNLD